jgi:hypothetical protein
MILKSTANTVDFKNDWNNFKFSKLSDYYMQATFLLKYINRLVFAMQK